MGSKVIFVVIQVTYSAKREEQGSGKAFDCGK
jgi:hypothetical protein